MEAFSLLKYWRGGGAVFNSDAPTSLGTADSSPSSSAATTTIVTAVSPSSSDSDSDGGDDGPFFDLEFTLPEEDDDSDSEEQVKDHKDLGPNVDKQVENASEKVKNDEGEVENSEEEEGEEDGGGEGEEIKFTLSSSSSGDSNDPNVTLSPSDDLFFKGRLVPIDSSSMILNATEALPKFPPVSSILKSATKFRVQMLKFNKSKSSSSEDPKKSEPQEKQENQERKRQASKLFTVKLKVEEVPLVSLFTRDNSSKGTNSKSVKRNASNDVVVENAADSDGPADERKFSKDVMQKYLKKVKPLYVRVSKRYGDKLRFSGQLSFPKSGAGPPQTTASSEVKPPTEKPTAVKGNGGGEGGEVVCEVAVGSSVVKTTQKQGNLQAGLRVVCKHLGKSRSASSSAVTAPAAPLASKRRDDSLLQQQDGIQSAILHCKRSFNASRDLEASILSRSVSDPSHEKSTDS